VAEVCKYPAGSFCSAWALGVRGWRATRAYSAGSHGCRPAKPKIRSPRRAILLPRPGHIKTQRHRRARPPDPARIFQGPRSAKRSTVRLPIGRRWPRRPQGAPHVVHRAPSTAATARSRVAMARPFARRPHMDLPPKGASAYSQLHHDRVCSPDRSPFPHRSAPSFQCRNACPITEGRRDSPARGMGRIPPSAKGLLSDRLKRRFGWSAFAIGQNGI